MIEAHACGEQVIGWESEFLVVDLEDAADEQSAESRAEAMEMPAA